MKHPQSANGVSTPIQGRLRTAHSYALSCGVGHLYCPQNFRSHQQVDRWYQNLSHTSAQQIVHMQNAHWQPVLDDEHLRTLLVVELLQGGRRQRTG